MESINQFLNTIIQGNSLSLLQEMPNDCVDCVITSPPYWNLRDYRVSGQIGSEASFLEYLTTLLSVFNEVKRVLKPTGTCFVNLGDVYGGSGNGISKSPGKRNHLSTYANTQSRLLNSTQFSKCLLLLPERFAISMIDSGWILRNQIIWHKPNQMPSGVTDRFVVDFEKVFFFVKQSINYFFNQQFEPYTTKINRWGGERLIASKASSRDIETNQNTYRNRNLRPNPKGKSMRTVWSINTEPFRDAHFAVFPQNLVLRLVKAGCPEKGIVLDPFIGAGTTALVAKKLNRHFIGFDLNPDYVALARKRLNSELGLFT